MTPYLKIDHVDKTFNRGSRETEVLKDVTLGVEKGEYVSIIGHSGCGKSTLLNIVAGLTAGDDAAPCCWRTRRSTSPGPDRAVVFQNHSLLPWLTVYDNVRLAVDKVFSGTKSRAERHDWTMHNLELVQMAHAKDKRPAEISGGMKQRVGLARALAMEPKVLLLDEPFGALDALTRAHLQDSVMAIHQKLGNTVMMITHDVDEAVLLSDRIVMMTNGPAAHIGEVLDVPLARPRRAARAVGRTRPTCSAASACSNSSTSGTASSRRPDRTAGPRKRPGRMVVAHSTSTGCHDGLESRRDRQSARTRSTGSGRRRPRLPACSTNGCSRSRPRSGPCSCHDIDEQKRKFIATLAVIVGEPRRPQQADLRSPTVLRVSTASFGVRPAHYSVGRRGAAVESRARARRRLDAGRCRVLAQGLRHHLDLHDRARPRN